MVTIAAVRHRTVAANPYDRRQRDPIGADRALIWIKSRRRPSAHLTVVNEHRPRPADNARHNPGEFWGKASVGLERLARMKVRRIGYAVAAIAAVLVAEWAVLQSIDRPTQVRSVPPSAARAAVAGGAFSLIDHRGRRVTEGDFRGRMLLILFGYSACPDICPITLQRVAAALDLLQADADNVQPVFITLDPERDSPTVLESYVAAFHPRLVGLTGSLGEIRRVAAAYRVHFAKTAVDADGYFLDHSAVLYLVDGHGRIATYLRHDATPEDIAEAVRRHAPGAPGVEG